MKKYLMGMAAVGLAVGMIGCCLSTLAHAIQPAAVDEHAGQRLAEREQDVLRQFRDLEKTFLRLADLLSTSDPRRSALLRSVFEQARTEEVGDRLDAIVQLLEKEQFLKAGSNQTSAIGKLRLLLDLLESGDADKRLANTKEEVKQFLARLSKLISRQRDIEGSTEAGGKESQLSDRQAALADETRGLSGDIGSFAERMEVRDSPADGKESEPGSKGEGSKGEGSKGEGSKGEGSKGEGSKGEGSKGEGSKGEGSKGEGSKGEGSKGEADSEASEGEDGEGQAGSQNDGDDEPSRARRTKQRLESAEKRMRKAREKLEQAQRRDARSEQEKAIEELETARAELEEILRQMREEEVERLLVQLEARVRAMLRAEKAVLAGSEKLATEAHTPLDRERQLEAVRLSREQGLISNDAVKALALVRDDGSAVAIPEALEQVREDSVQAAARLARGDVGGTTRGILQDIVLSLGEMLAALEKAQREQQAKSESKSGGRPAEPEEQPLVDKLAELKMIRSLQMRVNTRTKRYSQLLLEGAETVEEPELVEALDRLADRQRKIERAAHDIVTGRTE